MLYIREDLCVRVMPILRAGKTIEYDIRADFRDLWMTSLKTVRECQNGVRLFSNGFEYFLNSMAFSTRLGCNLINPVICCSGMTNS